jgi:hypothetical protein
LQELKNFRFEGAVGIAMDLRVFEKTTCRHVGFEFLPGEEVVISGMDFVLARGAGGTGNRVVSFPLLGKLATERGFAGP